MTPIKNTKTEHEKNIQKKRKKVQQKRKVQLEEINKKGLANDGRLKRYRDKTIQTKQDITKQ